MAARASGIRSRAIGVATVTAIAPEAVAHAIAHADDMRDGFDVHRDHPAELRARADQHLHDEPPAPREPTRSLGLDRHGHAYFSTPNTRSRWWNPDDGPRAFASDADHA